MNAAKSVLTGIVTIIAAVVAASLLLLFAASVIIVLGSPQGSPQVSHAELASAPSVSKPQATLGTPRMKIKYDKSRFYANASWGVEVTNHGTEPVMVTLYADFLDQDKLPVSQDIVLRTPVGPGTHDLTSMRMLTTEDASRVDSIHVQMRY